MPQSAGSTARPGTTAGSRWPSSANCYRSLVHVAEGQDGPIVGQFQLVAHDRGARVAHRLVLDHAGVVTRLALLDILPTRHVLHNVPGRRLAVNVVSPS
jgi:pimeloyl-ACP methyl ester carboxylesterase